MASVSLLDVSGDSLFQCSFIADNSNESLDIKNLLATAKSCDLQDVLSTSLSYSLSLDSTQSFEDVPPFASLLASRPTKTTTAFQILTPEDPSNRLSSHPSSRATITIPTAPRLKMMLIEPKVISKWADDLYLCLPLDHVPWRDNLDDSVEVAPPIWVAEGSLFAPEAFSVMFRHGLVSKSGAPMSTKTINEDSHYTHYQGDSSADTDQVVPSNQNDPSAQCDSSTDCQPSTLTMPTITISNSTVVVPISLSSSQCLLPYTPLAIRRGKKVPAPLSLSPASFDSPSKDLGLYPGIPTPFLGSPSTYSPTFEFSGNSALGAMDLNIMCDDLRSRCPPLRPESPLPEKPIMQESPALSHQSDSSDEDEWRFANEFLATYGDNAHTPQASVPNRRVTLAGQCSPPITESVNTVDSFSWATTPTLTDSKDDDSPPQPSRRRASAPDIAKQQRRKTVIIETSDSSRQTRVTLDLSGLSEDSSDADQQAVPFETRSHRLSFSPGAFSHSTPSRPPSSATLKAPVRGILKEKKSVRFSILPSMREYEPEDHSVEEPEPSSPPKLPQASVPTRRPRSNTPPRESVRLGSPLRQSFVANADEESFPISEQRLSDKDKNYRPSFPKHPAVRSIIKGATIGRGGNSSAPATPKLSATKSGATPTTDPRSSLRPLNGRQSLPVRTPSPGVSVSGHGTKGSPSIRGSVMKEDVGKPKKLRAKAGISMPARTRGGVVRDENSARRDTIFTSSATSGSWSKRSGGSAKATPPSKSASRMPTPLRSILTKLRT